MEKTIQQIQSVKENGETVQCYIRDLNTWENEMKRKEAALKSEAKQEIPPVRSRVKREKYLKNKKRNKKNSPSTQNKNWDTVDGNNSSEDMDMSEVAPMSLSLDGKQSEVIKQMKLKEEAQLQKERGNKFVKVERWDDAIACYNRAIQLVKDDAIYYANRGLCYLKKESLHQAEADCTEALRLDPTYVKALQRRASAREKLGSLRAASNDLTEVLKLEPHNAAAKNQLDCIRQRMGTKGRKAKSSPSNPTQPSPIGSPAAPSPKDTQSKPSTNGQKPPSKILGVPAASQIQPDIQPTPIKKVDVNAELANWKDGVGEDILVIKPVKKPPHLRSKRALKQIQIKEIPLGSTTEVKPKALIEEITEDQALADDKMSLNIDLNKEETMLIEESNFEEMVVDENKEEIVSSVTEEDKMATGDNQDVDNKKEKGRTETEKQKGELKDLKQRLSEMKGIASQMDDVRICEEKNLKNVANTMKRDMVPPANSVQFMSEWRNLKGDDAARSDYLCLLEPNRIPMVFANALESDVLSEILRVLHAYRQQFGARLAAYLKGLARVKRLPALVMFLAAGDKDILNQLLEHCKTTENCSDDDIAELKRKFEL